jgi:hypothetical protein
MTDFQRIADQHSRAHEKANETKQSSAREVIGDQQFESKQP